MVSNADFDFWWGKAYDIVYVPHAIMFDDYTRGVTKFPKGTCWEWMHCWLASGGVAHYGCNQFLRELVNAGIPLKQLDEFCTHILVPSTRSNLTSGFFRGRIVDKNGAHMRAFASEMITAVQSLGIFIDVVSKPASAIPAHVACFDRLREIVGLLIRWGDACRGGELIKRTVLAHHFGFSRRCTRSVLSRSCII